jgi:DNA ligase D
MAASTQAKSGAAAAKPGRAAAKPEKDAIEVAGVRLSSPDKVLYPEQGITKRELADYYVAIADVMLPHIRNRPITLVRCPAGRQKKCFYQRHAGSGVPAELGEVLIPGFEEPYLFLRDVRGLIAIVQMGVLELHSWGACKDRPDRPDRMVLDLDPGEGTPFTDVVAASLELRDRLAAMGLRSFAKTTGGKGLHVVVPLARRHDWAEVKSFARRFSEEVAAAAPDRFLTKISIAERKGRIFIDYLRNDPTSTAVAPYSSRARPGAPVSMPLDWSEVTPALDPAAFTIRTAPERMRRLGADPWAAIFDMRQRLPAPPPGAASAPSRPRRRRAAKAPGLVPSV